MRPPRHEALAVIVVVTVAISVWSVPGVNGLRARAGRSIDFASIDPNPKEFKHGALMLVRIASLLYTWPSHLRLCLSQKE